MIQKDIEVVRDPRVAELLTTPKESKRLKPFISRACTLGEAARELNMKLPGLTYHVNKFVDLGVLMVTCQPDTQGRMRKHYQSVAKAFFVPFTLTSNANLGDLMKTMYEPVHQTVMRDMADTLWDTADKQKAGANQLGVMLSMSEDNHLQLQVGQQPDKQELISLNLLDYEQPALFDAASLLNFDFDTAKALQKDLNDLFERYEALAKPGHQAYIVRFTLVPIKTESFA